MAFLVTDLVFFSKFPELPSANAPKGIRSIVAAVARCRFKASNADTDEVVLFQILNLLLACLLSPVGHLLTNKLVYEITQTCFKMSTQDHLSGTSPVCWTHNLVLLRKAAEMTLMEMVRYIFSNFHGHQIEVSSESENEVWSPIGKRNLSRLSSNPTPKSTNPWILLLNS